MGRLAADLGAARAVAIDTEADSLHHYPGKLCLVQAATDGAARTWWTRSPCPTSPRSGRRSPTPAS